MPVIRRVPSLTRKAARAPTSSMSTNWCSGAAAASMASSSSKWAIPLAARVRIGPGEIALARICLGPSSAAPRRCNPPRGHADRPRARKQSHAAGSPVGPTLLGSSRMQPPVGLGLAHRRAASTCSRASRSQGGHMAAPCRSGRLPRECRPPATKARAQPAAMTPSSRVTTPADLGVIDRVESIVMDAGIRRRLASNESAPSVDSGDQIPSRIRSCRFTLPTWRHVLVLVAGATLSPGRRTVAAALRVVGLDQEASFTNYHRVLNRNSWSSRRVAGRLLRLLVSAFIPDGPVIIGLDDTLERRWGSKIKARGIYRDPVRSSHGHFVKASGLRWLSVMLLPDILPWLAASGDCRS